MTGKASAQCSLYLRKHCHHRHKQHAAEFDAHGELRASLLTLPELSSKT